MSKFKEVVHNEERIYIHNDLANSVFHAKENVLRVKKTQTRFSGGRIYIGEVSET
jgi:hypothetical protein